MYLLLITLYLHHAIVTGLKLLRNKRFDASLYKKLVPCFSLPIVCTQVRLFAICRKANKIDIVLGKYNVNFAYRVIKSLSIYSTGHMLKFTLPSN